ncbi:ABC transporter permease [Herpetosiphon llansteffanensis]
MKNLPLTLGLLITGLMLLIAIFGPSLAPHDPLAENRSFRYQGKFYGGPPREALPPFVHPEHPLGFDDISRDLLSRLLWAVRPTLILCVIIASVRLALGMAIGGITGLLGQRVAWVLDTMMSITSAIPILIIALGYLIWTNGTALVIYQGTTPMVANKAGITAFLIALCLTGWVNSASVIQGHVQKVLQAQYLESAHAIGLTRWQIAYRYILPQMLPLLPMLLASELTAVTLIVAELGYLGYFIGGSYVYSDFTKDVPLPDIVKQKASQPELGQMLSDFFGQYSRSPWVSVFAGILMVLLLVGFTLTSEGLRRQLDITRPRRWNWRGLFQRKTSKTSKTKLNQTA